MMNSKNRLIKQPVLMIPILLTLVGCTAPVETFIPGTYVTEWTTEFTAARDTILIEPLQKSGSFTYQITRRTYMLYQKKPQYKLVHWTGIFNHDNNTIMINNNGRVFSFDPANKQMKMGATTYTKL